MAVDLGPYDDDPRIIRVDRCAVRVVTSWALQTSENVLAFAGVDRANTGVPFADMAGALRWLLGGPPLTALAYALQRTYTPEQLHRMRADIASVDMADPLDLVASMADPWDLLDIALAASLGIPTQEDGS